MGVFDQDLYKSILKEWYPKGWAKIKKLRGFARRHNRWKRDKHDGRKEVK
jgi:hypothetical protein